MRISKLSIAYVMLILIFSSGLPMSVSSSNNSIPFWNKDWAYRQEIQLPIATNDSLAKYQPIDIRMIFNNPCWTKNENVTSVRVCCWNGEKWFELESQIYDLSFIDSNHLQECSLIFLVPEIANGDEKYFVYYDDNEKLSPNYLDHVSIEDSTYSFSPISSISIEANYFGIKEDGFYIYGVGQEGNLLNRAFSQIVVKQKKDMEKIDVLDSDQIVSLAFSYYCGDKEADESSSDQIFISKEILIDGNLMIEFGIKSESKRRDIRTTILYRYYYTPLDEKRLSIRVKHEMLESVIVKGKENIDGRFGMMASFKSRSPTIDKLNVGDIYPYLHFFGENDKVNEYRMNLEPESKKREWIVSYKDDADLGKEGWIAYGNGQEGKVNSIIFSSDKDVIKSGVDERDGIQIKIAEKEYFDFLSAEVDYASINFGRNSFEKGYSHDLRIPEDLIVMFDAELFSSDEGGYEVVRKEAKIYQQLVKHRYFSEDSTFEKQQRKHELTVFTYLGGTRFSYPRLSNITGNFFPVIWIELWQDGKQILSGEANKPLFFRYRSYKIFPEVIEGDYLIKVFWKLGDSNKFFTGAKTVTINKYTRVHIFCSWERPIHATFIDQYGNGIEGVRAVLLNNKGDIFDENTTDKTGSVVLKAPFSFGDPYLLKAFYKDLIVHEDRVRNSVVKLRLKLDLELYDFTVKVEDKFNLPPGVEITPTLSKTYDEEVVQLIPTEIERGLYLFEKIPSGDYKIQVSYANFIDERNFNIPNNGDFVVIRFSAAFDLIIDLFDLQANPLLNSDINLKVYRDGNKIIESDERVLSLPPAYYTINAYNNGNLVGFKDVDFTSNRNIKLITTLSSSIPVIILGSILVFLGIIITLALKKIIPIITLLKFLAISLLIIALIQPWWGLSGSSTQPISERNTLMFLNPQVMIESIFYNGRTSYDIAEMPELFVDFLGNILIVVYVVCTLLGLSFVSRRFGKKHYSLLLNLLAIILIIGILSTFYFGTSKVTEASIGNVMGEGLLSIELDVTIYMYSHWGFSSGFYLAIIATILVIITIVLEIKNFYIKQRK